jgi:hypothetical protein
MKFSDRPFIRLRGHHLICLHFFSGEGYALEFIANLRKVLERAGSGEDITICTGADDICCKCSHLKGERCLADENSDVEIREMDRRALKLLRLKADEKVQWELIKDKIPEIIEEWTKAYCNACDWRKACAAFPSSMRDCG